MFTGTGTGEILPRGDGDGGISPDGEFPVAILTGYSVTFEGIA